MDLTSSQKKMLSGLIDLHQQTGDPIKTGDLATEVNRNSGTVHNHMQNLKSLQLVEGVPGPTGGYKPTAKAYETLEIEQIDDSATVRLMRNSEVIENVDVVEINLSSVLHPNICRGKIHIQGSIRHFHENDLIVVGPTPISELQITGTIDGIDEMNSILIIQVTDMTAPAEDSSQ